jgi:anti-sigma regulatory factor (Ser/Thr protein kinase)
MAEINREPAVRLELTSQARFLAAARAMISNLAQRLGFNDVQCGQISLAVDEALCNIINHGYDKRPDGRIWLSVWTIEGTKPGIRIVIEDRAKQVDPQMIRSRDLEDIRPGGLGVYIIREVMDEVTYEKREGGGMRLTMLKLVASAKSATDGQASAKQRTVNKAKDHR